MIAKHRYSQEEHDQIVDRFDLEDPSEYARSRRTLFSSYSLSTVNYTYENHSLLINPDVDIMSPHECDPCTAYHFNLKLNPTTIYMRMVYTNPSKSKQDPIKWQITPSLVDISGIYVNSFLDPKYFCLFLCRDFCDIIPNVIYTTKVENIYMKDEMSSYLMSIRSVTCGKFKDLLGIFAIQINIISRRTCGYYDCQKAEDLYFHFV
jgi:hypothetical protein